MPYEYHEYEDKRLRVIFHLDELQRTGSTFHMHWHENIELLYFVGGTATVQEDNTIVQVNPGEIAVIGSNQLHTLESISERCLYYCLIIDKRLCEELEIPVDGLRLPPKTAVLPADGQGVLRWAAGAAGPHLSGYAAGNRRTGQKDGAGQTGDAVYVRAL